MNSFLDFKYLKSVLLFPSSKHIIFICGIMLWPHVLSMYVSVLQQSSGYMVTTLYDTLQRTSPLQFIYIYLHYIYSVEHGQFQTCLILAFWYNNISLVRLRITSKFRGDSYLTENNQIFRAQQSKPFAVRNLGTYHFSTLLTVFSTMIG